MKLTRAGVERIANDPWIAISDLNVVRQLAKALLEMDDTIDDALARGESVMKLTRVVAVLGDMQKAAQRLTAARLAREEQHDTA